MSKFDLTATAECWRCGSYLSSSDEDCDTCDHRPLKRYRFIRIGDESQVQTVWAINPIRAWAELHEQGVENVISWRLQYRGTSLDYARMGYDVTDPDELRTPQHP